LNFQGILGVSESDCFRGEARYQTPINQISMSKRFVILTVCICGIALQAAEWSQFRGPQASGVDAGTALPTKWNIGQKENIAWRAAVPGLAHSSPIARKDRVYLTTVTSGQRAELKVGLYGDIASANDNGEQVWRILAMDARTGKIAWDKIGFQGVPRVKRHTKATHCNSTSATDGKRIVTIFGSEGLFCFDMEGDLLWKKDLGQMNSGYFAHPSAQWGFASSPVIHEGKAVVQCDVQTNSFIAVFDLEDGRELWRTARQDVPTWSTPTVVTTGAKTQILVNGWHHTGGYDFATGKEVWKLDGGGDIPVPTPIIGDGVAYFTSAHGRFRPMMAIRLEASGDITPAQVGTTNQAIAWAHPRQGNYMQTPILVGDYLYGCFDNGIVTCFDAKTGAIQFSERLSATGQGFTASPVSDGRHIYFPSETGNVFVLAAKPKFTVVATNTLDETCMATPAISNGRLYFRAREHLVCVSSAE
jgi:outer membrane protein assembly factor BamB